MNGQGAPRTTDSIAPLLACAAVLCAACFLPQVLNDGDTYLHIAAGQWMLAHGAILHADPFSYTFAGRPWQTHEWLSELLMALAFSAGGWAGVILLSGAAAALAAGLLAFHLARWFSGVGLALILVLGLGCLAPSLLVRPHVLALPLLELWTAGLVMARADRRAPSWLLVPVMVVWANLHGSFLFGLALVAPLAIEAVIESKDARLKTAGLWSAFALASVAASMVSPHGVDNLLFPFRLLGMSGLSAIGEWGGATFDTLQPFEIAILAGLFVFLSRGVRLPLIRLLIVLGLLHLSLQHVRYQFLFGVVVPLVIAEPLALALRRAKDGSPETAPKRTNIAQGWVAVMIGIAIVGIAAARLWLPVTRTDGPVAAVAHVPASLLARPVFNDYGFGAYLLFKGVRPFIDSRAELYGDRFLGVYDAMAHAQLCALRANFDRYAIDWTLLSPRSPVVPVLDVSPGWRRLYADSFAVVQVYDPSDNPAVSRIPGPACVR